jgi:hypothetical protein
VIRTSVYRFFFVRRRFFRPERRAGTSEKVDEVRSMGNIGAHAVVLVLTFPSFSVVVVRMGMGILLSTSCAVLRVTRTDTVLNDSENERAGAPTV